MFTDFGLTKRLSGRLCCRSGLPDSAAGSLPLPAVLPDLTASCRLNFTACSLASPDIDVDVSTNCLPAVAVVLILMRRPNRRELSK